MGGGEVRCDGIDVATDRKAGGGVESAPAKPVNVAVMPVAPNNMKHPSTTVIPRRDSNLPDSMSIPIVATAMTATIVAVLPRAAP